MGEKMNSQDKKKNEKENGEKKDSSKSAVVLKIQMHCHGCAKKVIKSIKSFEIEGVEDVKADSSVNKVLVFGKVVDPFKLQEKVESKTKKKVDLISPLPNDKRDKNKKPEEKSEKKVTTVTLKTILHCQGCTQKIRKSILKVKGVEGVTVNKLQDLVIVKGSMNVDELVTHLKKKYKRNVDIIPQKKESGGGEKKGKASENGGGGGGEKKVKEKGGEAHAKELVKPELPVSKMDYFGMGYGYCGYNQPGYVIEYVHAPQLFSEENPNACSIM